MRCATLGVLLAFFAWLGVTVAASLSERKFPLMDDADTRSLYNDNSGITALNWIDDGRRAFSCLFLQDSGIYYCGMNIQLGDGFQRGVNFSEYSKIRLSLEYMGSSERMRVGFRNAFKDKNVVPDTKHLEVDIPIRTGTHIYEIPLDNFDVADWWLATKLDSAEYKEPARNNVIHVGFHIGNPLPIGQHYFNVLEFSVVKPWLSAANTVWWAVASVMYFALTGFIYNFFRLRAQLKQRSEEMFGLLTKLEQADTESTHFKRLSMYDPLTGLLNRRAALELVEKFARHNSLAGTVLVVMDIDHFKRVNDTYGHDVGDEVLKLASATVQRLLREGDAAVRWGGEEIVIICPKTTSEGTVRVAEKLRSAIKQLRFSQPDLRISASFGATAIQRGETFEHAFSRADEALYEAKRGGRDRVCERE